MDSDDRPFAWPKRGDSLFSSNLKLPTYSFPIGEDCWSTYALSYRQAAEIVVGELQSSRVVMSSTLLPALFLFRHYIEIRLKELVVLCGKILGEEQSISSHHKLYPSWGRLKGLARRIDNQFQGEEVEVVEKCIKELSELDERGDVFRYPVDTQGNTNLNRTSIPIENFAKTMEAIANYLDGATDYYYAHYQAQCEMAADFGPDPSDFM